MRNFRTTICAIALLLFVLLSVSFVTASPPTNETPTVATNVFDAAQIAPVQSIDDVVINRKIERQTANQITAPPVVLPEKPRIIVFATADTNESESFYRKIPDKNLTSVLPVSLDLPRTPPKIVSRN